VDEDLDFGVLTDSQLKARIDAVSPAPKSPLMQRKLAVMRAELINRIRARGRAETGPRRSLACASR